MCDSEEIITSLIPNNYYGYLAIKKHGSEYFWGIENYSGVKWYSITEEMYDFLFANAERSK